jgi:protoporphyrinogen/coproporphyrinogen III oxidase
MAEPLRAAVVGAGPAGLAAALRLARAGARVTVFEALDGPGGRTRSHEVDGVRIDPSVQLLGSVYTNTLSVLREAGGERLAERSPGRDALWRGGRAHEVVYGSTASMLSSGALPVSLKLKLGAVYLPFLRRHAEVLDLHALERAARAGLDRESAAAWGERELGRDFVDLLAAPLLATLYGTPAAEASAGFYHALTAQGMKLQVLALRGGSGALCDLLAAAVVRLGGEVRCGASVLALRTAGHGVEVSTEAGAETFDAAVIAVPAPAARELVGDWMPALGDWLDRVEVRPAATLGLVLERRTGANWFGLSFARGESRAVAAACALENKLPGYLPADRGALVVFPLPDVAPRMAGATPEQAYAAVMPDLRRALPGLDALVRAVQLYRWPHGWTVFRTGYLAHLERFRQGALETEPRVALAGDYLYAPNVEGAVTSGLRAAERVLRGLGVGVIG